MDVAGALIGKALLVESVEKALLVAGRYGDVTVVSVDGTVVHPDGAVSGGSGDSVASAILEQQREIKQLGEEVGGLEQRVEERLESHEKLTRRIVELETSREQARHGAHQTEIEHVTTEKDLLQLDQALETAAQRLSQIDEEEGELAVSASSTEEDQRRIERLIGDLEAALERHREGLSKAAAQLSEDKERSVAQARLLTERKVRLAQVREQIEGSRSALGRVVAESADLSQRAERLVEELSQASRDYGTTAANLMRLGEERRAAQDVASEAHAVFDKVQELLDQIRGVLTNREGELRELREGLTEAQEGSQKAEMDVQKLQIEREHLLGRVSEKFRGLDLNRVVGDYHSKPAPDAEHRRRIDELTKLIDRMGPVNLDAKAEYEDAEKRFV
jgi:chromosome segregation protein